MDIAGIVECLSDERCGLFFLAGLDPARVPGAAHSLTIHAAAGAIAPEQGDYMQSVLRTLDPSLTVELRLHDSHKLYSPRCLEGFAEAFAHEIIVADPTGAFARAHEMVGLAVSLRAALQGRVEQIHWVQEKSELHVVVDDAPTAPDPTGSEFGQLAERIRAVIQDVCSTNLANAIQSVRVSGELPVAKYTPVDNTSVLDLPPPPVDTRPAARTGLAMSLMRIAAAVIGFGTAATASAALPPAGEEINSPSPGISALVGLTTLGENSFGIRNHYRAIGGLRLYFGDTGILIASTMGSAAPPQENPGIGAGSNGPLGEDSQASEEPMRIASPE